MNMPPVSSQLACTGRGHGLSAGTASFFLNLGTASSHSTKSSDSLVMLPPGAALGLSCLVLQLSYALVQSAKSAVADMDNWPVALPTAQPVLRQWG